MVDKTIDNSGPSKLSYPRCIQTDFTKTSLIALCINFVQFCQKGGTFFKSESNCGTIRSNCWMQPAGRNRNYTSDRQSFLMSPEHFLELPSFIRIALRQRDNEKCGGQKKKANRADGARRGCHFELKSNWDIILRSQKLRHRETRS